MDAEPKRTQANTAILREMFDQFAAATTNRKMFGLAFGRECYLLRQEFAHQGRRGAGPTFAGELKSLGIPRATAYFWTRRFEEESALRPKRVAAKKQHRPTLDEVLGEFGLDCGALLGPDAKIFVAFCTLVPVEALHSAYKAAAKGCHPDVGGTAEQMQQLNDIWERVKALKMFA